MSSPGKLIAVAIITVLVLGGASCLAWKRLAGQGRADLAARAVANLVGSGVVIACLAYSGGSLVGYDFLGYWAMTREGSAPQGPLIAAALCAAVGLGLIVRFMQAMQSLFEVRVPVASDADESELRDPEE